MSADIWDTVPSGVQFCPLSLENTCMGRVLGVYIQRVHVMLVLLGISETQKNNRQKRNLISTKINFIAWLVEVSLYPQNNH